MALGFPQFVPHLRTAVATVGNVSAGLTQAAAFLATAELMRRLTADLAETCKLNVVSDKVKEGANWVDKKAGNYPSSIATTVGDWTGVSRARELARPYTDARSVTRGGPDGAIDGGTKWTKTDLAKSAVAAFVLSTLMFEGVHRYVGPSHSILNKGWLHIGNHSVLQDAYTAVRGLVK